MSVLLASAPMSFKTQTSTLSIFVQEENDG